ncbi:hypothetical protein [[Eubacterium] cellulosolvens]
MKLNTCSAVLRFTTTLEEETAKFYDLLAQKYPQAKETFELFSRENKKFKLIVERAYYGVISDALEACFSFKEGLDTDQYSLKTDQDISFHDVLQVAIDNESKIQKAYIDAAGLSEALMADVPRSFRLVARKREDRITKIKSLMKKPN